MSYTQKCSATLACGKTLPQKIQVFLKSIHEYEYFGNLFEYKYEYFASFYKSIWIWIRILTNPVFKYNEYEYRIRITHPWFTHLRPLHTQMSEEGHALPPCSFSRVSYSKTKKKTPTVAHLSVPLQSFNLLWLKVKEKVRWNYIQWTSSRLSSYRHGICLSIQLKLRCGTHNTFPFLDCSLPFLPGGKKKIVGFWSILWCTWDRVGDSRKISGTWAFCTLDKVLCYTLIKTDKFSSPDKFFLHTSLLRHLLHDIPHYPYT